MTPYVPNHPSKNGTLKKQKKHLPSITSFINPEQLRLFSE